MKARPILFSGQMVMALLAGTKSQTRRVVKPQPSDERNWHPKPGSSVCGDLARIMPGYCPYGQTGDLLWARETWFADRCYDHLPPRDIPKNAPTYYAEKIARGWHKARPSIFLMRDRSRLTLELTDVRVERVQEISANDADAEGAKIHPGLANINRDLFLIASYQAIWESINGAGSWSENPFVWALTFVVHRCNVDDLLRQREAV